MGIALNNENESIVNLLHFNYTRGITIYDLSLGWIMSFIVSCIQTLDKGPSLCATLGEKYLLP